MQTTAFNENDVLDSSKPASVRRPGQRLATPVLLPDWGFGSARGLVAPLDSSHPPIFVWYVTPTPGYGVSLTVMYIFLLSTITVAKDAVSILFDVIDVFKFALRWRY